MNRPYRACLLLGTSTPTLPQFRATLAALCRELASIPGDLVYGGTTLGLMDVAAEHMLALNRSVIGVIPENSSFRAIERADLSQVIRVRGMDERVAVMVTLSDVVIVFPGGWGTVEELFRLVVRAVLGEVSRPIGLLNVDGYFDDLLRFLHRSATAGFLAQDDLDSLIVDDDPARLPRRLQSHNSRMPRPRGWIETSTLENDGPRIAIVGSSGTGKSTLARALSEHLGLPLSVEGVAEAAAALGIDDLRTLTTQTRAELTELVLAERVEREIGWPAFVSDRSSVDSAAYWLLRVSHALRDPKRGEKLLAACRQHVSRYTHVYVLPHGVLPLRENGIRTADAVYQTGMHALLRGLLEEWRIPWSEVPVVGLAERVNFIAAEVAHSSSPAASTASVRGSSGPAPP